MATDHTAMVNTVHEHMLEYVQRINTKSPIKTALKSHVETGNIALMNDPEVRARQIEARNYIKSLPHDDKLKVKAYKTILDNEKERVIEAIKQDQNKSPQTVNWF